MRRFRLTVVACTLKVRDYQCFVRERALAFTHLMLLTSSVDMWIRPIPVHRKFKSRCQLLSQPITGFGFTNPSGRLDGY